MTPTMGPLSGGTPVTLHGSNLDIGTSRSIVIGDSPCDIVKVRYTYIKSSIDNVVYLHVCTSAAEVGWEMHFLISNTTTTLIAPGPVIKSIIVISYIRT